MVKSVKVACEMGGPFLEIGFSTERHSPPLYLWLERRMLRMRKWCAPFGDVRKRELDSFRLVDRIGKNMQTSWRANWLYAKNGLRRRNCLEGFMILKWNKENNETKRKEANQPSEKETSQPDKDGPWLQVLFCICLAPCIATIFSPKKLLSADHRHVSSASMHRTTLHSEPMEEDRTPQSERPASERRQSVSSRTAQSFDAAWVLKKVDLREDQQKDIFFNIRIFVSWTLWLWYIMIYKN